MTKQKDETTIETTAKDPGQELADLSRLLDEMDAEAAAEEAKRAEAKGKKTKVAREPRPCVCGCGITTKRSWAPGHDGVLSGVAVRATKGGKRTSGGPREGDGALLARYAANIEEIRGDSAHHAGLIEAALAAIAQRAQAKVAKAS